MKSHYLTWYNTDVYTHMQLYIISSKRDICWKCYFCANRFWLEQSETQLEHNEAFHKSSIHCGKAIVNDLHGGQLGFKKPKPGLAHVSRSWHSTSWEASPQHFLNSCYSAFSFRRLFSRHSPSAAHTPIPMYLLEHNYSAFHLLHFLCIFIMNSKADLPNIASWKLGWFWRVQWFPPLFYGSWKT